MTVKSLTAAALVAFATPLSAEITALDAWDFMRENAENSGLTVTVGGTGTSGTGLTLTNVRYVMDVPDASLVMHLDRILFEELGDGRVRMTMSDIPLAFKMNAEGEEVEILGHFSMPGAESILSGDPDAITNDFTAPEMVFSLDGLLADGEAQEVSGSLRAVNTKGTSTVTAAGDTDDFPTQSSRHTVETVTIDAEFALPEEEVGQVSITGAIRDLVVSGEGAVFAFGDEGIPEGASSTGEFLHGGSDLAVTIDGPDGDMLIQISDQGGRIEAGLVEGSLFYRNEVQGTRVVVSGSALGLPPIEVSLKSSGGEMLMPMTPSTEDREFAFALRMSQLEVSDFLWSMLDPFNALPHDPADIVIAVSGTGKLAVDVFDPDFNPEAMTAAPGKLSSLKVDELLLRAVGAEIVATGGAVNVEENPLAMPRMKGSLDISAKGIQGLMENLGKMGILPVQQAAMGNMMLGMFAIPGSEPDTFTSKIEFTEDGGILANGQRLQ